MNKRVLKTASSDRLILVNSKKLFEFADEDDVKCRNSEIIADLYHPDWFFTFDGHDYFSPPAIYIVDGVVKFINGRHRTILLSRHLDAFPMLIGNLDMDHCGGGATEKSLNVLSEITVGELTEHSIFENLPELEYGNFPPA